MAVLDRLFVMSQYVAPQHALSKACGKVADCKIPSVKNRVIRQFISHYHVNMDEALRSSPEDYADFNDFFTRELKATARPNQAGRYAIASPVDGTVSQAGKIEYGRIFQAKGHSFSLIDLLGGETPRANPFMGGEFTTIYLAPKDYHRIHMPCYGELKEMVYIPGKLFSVNPLTTKYVPGLFARNERVVCIFETTFGPMALIMIGAMVVASIATVWSGLVAPEGKHIRRFNYSPGEVCLNQGDEAARFLLGSTVVLLFPEHQITFNKLVKAGNPMRLGNNIASLNR